MTDGTRRIARALSVLAMLGCVMFGAQAQEPVPAGNVAAYWPFDALTNGNTQTPDQSTNGNTATLTGTPTLVAGQFGNGLQFNGTDQMLTVPANASMDVGTGSFSLACWINPTNVTTKVRLINKWNGTTGFLLDLNADDAGGNVAGTVRLNANDGINFGGNVPAGLVAGTWTHIAVTVYRFGKSAQCIFYKDGNVIGTMTKQSNGTTLTNTSAMQIAAQGAPAANFYGGILDELFFCKRALVQEEVRALMSGGVTTGAYVTQGVGNPGPVVSQSGLLGTYYSFPVNSNTSLPSGPGGANLGPGSTPTSPMTTPPTQGGTALLAREIDATIDADYATVLPPALTANGKDWWMVEWTGFLRVPANGDYTFYVTSDDGERLWVGNVTSTTPTLDMWKQRPSATDTSAPQTLTAGLVPIRLEYEQGNGGTNTTLEWSSAAIPRQVIPSCYLVPPTGPATPANLTATGSTNSATASVSVSWTATTTTPVTAISYVLSRATAAAGPYTQVAVQTGTTFTDNTVSFGNSYYYVIQATDVNGLLVGSPSAPSTPATPVQPPITVSPPTVTTSENGTNAQIILTINVSPATAGSVTIASDNQSQALVSGQGNADATVQGPAQSITINILAGTAVNTTFTITVVAQRDFIDNGNQTYTISFTGGGVWAGVPISSVAGTNLDVDAVGVLIAPTAGLVTDTNGTPAQFSVQLNSKPAPGTTVAFSVTSSDPTEGTVNPPTLSFDSNTWNIAQAVTITGQGINQTFLDTPYTVTVSSTGGAGTDPAYNGTGGTVFVLNRHLEAPPALKHVWGSSGGGGGCGLTGLDAVLLLGLAAAIRRRRAA